MRYDAPDTIRQDVAKLMRFIGKEVNMKYKYKISNSDGGDLVPEMLQNLGYRNASTTDGAYNYSKIKSCLDSKRPIYIEGYEEKIKFLGMTVNYDGGHAWVIDGYIEQYLDKTTTITITYIATGNIVYKETIRDYNPSPETKSFIHHNWGWGGHYNGYFAPESYDSRNAMQKESNATRGSAGNFKYGHSFYYNIQP